MSSIQIKMDYKDREACVVWGLWDYLRLRGMFQTHHMNFIYIILILRPADKNLWLDTVVINIWSFLPWYPQTPAQDALEDCCRKFDRDRKNVILKLTFDSNLWGFLHRLWAGKGLKRRMLVQLSYGQINPLWSTGAKPIYRGDLYWSAYTHARTHCQKITTYCQ